MTNPLPDYSGLAQTVELDPETIRACIAALPNMIWSTALTSVEKPLAYRARAKQALEALLPKPDPVKALVEEYDIASKDDKHTMPRFLTAHEDRLLKQYTRWLIESGRIKG